MEAAGPLALHLLGILYAHEERYEEAEEALLGVVEAEPEMAGSYVELGLVYVRRGEYGKMAEALRKAVEVGGGGVRAYLGEQPLRDAPGVLSDAAASGQAGVVQSRCRRGYSVPGAGE
jgi:tetratricopeptide (TPR) repeat protein